MTHVIDIRQFRKDRKWTQPRLAEALDVHLATLVRLEKQDNLDRRTELALQRLAEIHPPINKSSPPG